MMFSTGSNNIYNSYSQQQSTQNVNIFPNNIPNFTGSIDSLIEYKFSKINSNIQSGNFYQIKNNFFKRVYIISKADFEKLTQPNMNNNMYQQNPFGFINFYSTINELMNSISQMNSELYFVKEEFFIMKGIQVNEMNLVYLIKDENKITLFFQKEKQNNQTLELKIKNDEQVKNKIVNMINNMNLNSNPKENTLKKLILLSAFEKEFLQLMKTSIIDEYDTKEFYLINKNIIEKFKTDHNSFMSLININFDFSYKGFSKNLQKIINMHQNSILNNPQFNNYQLNNIYKDETNFKPNINKYWDNIDYPYEFILVPENLFDLFYNDFSQHNIKKEDFKYNVLIGNDVLFVQNKINNCIFNAYKINAQNGMIEVICSFKYNEESSFYSEVKKYIKGYGLENYFNKRQLDQNSSNQINTIKENDSVFMQYIFLNKMSSEDQKLLSIKNEFKRNLKLFEMYNEFIKKVNNLEVTNIEINNINGLEENINNLQFVKCIVIFGQNLISIKEKLYFDKILMLENEIKQNNFNLENNQIIKDIVNNPNQNNMQELLNQAFIFNGIKVDENYKNKSVFSYINLNLILSINESPEIVQKFKNAEANLFINKNNSYLYYPSTKKLFKITNLTQNGEFALEEVIFGDEYKNLYEKLKELIKDDDEEKTKLKYSIKYMSNQSLYCYINKKWLDEFKKFIGYDIINRNSKDYSSWVQYMEQNKSSQKTLFNNQMLMNLDTYKNLGININIGIPKNFGIINKEIFNSIITGLKKIYNINQNELPFNRISFGGHRLIMQSFFNPQIYLLYIKINSIYELDYIIIIQNNNISLSNLFSNCAKEETLEEILSLYYKINLRQNNIQNLIFNNQKIGEIYIARPQKEKKMKEGNHCLGLQNIGATCYMNATIQCLCHVTKLKNYFLNEENVMKDMKNKNCPLTKEFYNLINILWKENFEGKNYYAPNGFKDIISEMNPLFQGIAANDSKDLIIFLYENIHREINNPPQAMNLPILNIIINSPETQALHEFRSDYYPKNSSIIIDTFYFEHQNQIKCLNCQFVRTNYNIYNILIFPLEKVREFMIKRYPGNLCQVTLENCFENYQENELLCGTNQIYCNNCNQMSDAANINMIYNSPEVMTIILNRGKGIQFDVVFDYPLFLNIDKFIVDTTHCKNNNYELICVLSHLGPSGMSGHFIAFCKSPVDGKWYMYNDAQVSECSDPKNQSNTMIENLPYVLFYQKFHGNNNKITLFIKYIDKEVYLDVEKDITISELIKRINAKYGIPINIMMYLEQDNKLMLLNNDRLISSYPNIKDGAKIVAKIY